MKNAAILTILFTFLSLVSFSQSSKKGTVNPFSSNCPTNLLGEIDGETLLCDSALFAYTKYQIALTPGVSYYNWTLPQGMMIRRGQGINKIFVEIDYTFNGGYVTVSGQTHCGTTATDSIYVDVVPPTPQFLTFDDYILPDLAYEYSVEQVNGVNYVWTAPYGAIIMEGQGSTSVKIKFSQSFTGGDVEVYAENSCAAGLLNNITVALATSPSLMNGNTLDVLDEAQKDQHSLFNEKNLENDNKTVLSTELKGIHSNQIYNYPNPVSSTTRFYINLGNEFSNAESVKINIFDIKGQLVKSIQTNDNNGQGVFNTESWNAADEGGNGLSAGVYFYSITAEDNNGKIKTIRANSNINIVK